MIALWLILQGCAAPPEGPAVEAPTATPIPAPPVVAPESNIVVHGRESCTWQGIELRVDPPHRLGCGPSTATASFEQEVTNEEARAWAANLLEAQGFTLVARPRDQRGWVQDPYYVRGDMGVEVSLFRGNAADGGPMQVLLAWWYKGKTRWSYD